MCNGMLTSICKKVFINNQQILMNVLGVYTTVNQILDVSTLQAASCVNVIPREME